jgi:hypothetical protein
MGNCGDAVISKDGDRARSHVVSAKQGIVCSYLSSDLFFQSQFHTSVGNGMVQTSTLPNNNNFLTSLLRLRTQQLGPLLYDKRVSIFHILHDFFSTRLRKFAIICGDERPVSREAGLHNVCWETEPIKGYKAAAVEKEDDGLLCVVGWRGRAGVDVYLQGEGPDSFEGVGLLGCHLVSGIGKEDEGGEDKIEEDNVEIEETEGIGGAYIFSRSGLGARIGGARAPFTAPIRCPGFLMIGSYEFQLNKRAYSYASLSALGRE